MKLNQILKVFLKQAWKTNKIQVNFYAVFVCIILPFVLTSQSKQDSLNQILKDSIQKIPLSIKVFKAFQSEIKTNIDTNNILLFNQNEGDYILRLNNYFSPIYFPGNDIWGKRIYDHGIHSLRFNTSDLESFQFILPTKAISEISTHRGRSFTNSQSSFQDNFDLNLMFASPFKNNVLWNFSYDRQIYKGIYSHGKQKNTLFTTGVHYTNSKETFQANVLFLDERHFSEDNWGIISDSVFSDANYKIRESVPVRNNRAETNLFERSIGLNLNYNPKKQFLIFNPSLKYQLAYSLYSYNHTDPETDSLNSFYRAFVIDSFVNNLLSQKFWSQSMILNLILNDSFYAGIGVRYEHTILDHDTLQNLRNSIQLDILTRMQIFRKFNLDSRFSLLVHKGTITPDASIKAAIIKNPQLALKAELFYNAHPIPYLFSKLVLNKKYFWDHSYNSIYSKEIGIKAHLEIHKLLPSKLYFGISRISNLPYFDSLSLPQTSESINKYGASITIPFKWKWLMLQNQFHYEFYSPDVIHLNGWHSKHQIGLHKTLFKKVVNANLGAVLRLYQYDYKLNFNPIIQSFYTSNTRNELISSVGIFMNFKISEFNFTIDVEHLDSFWKTNRPSVISNYPIYDFFFRMGITWRFLN